MATTIAPREPLYLDFAASSFPAEEVVEAMLPWLRHHHANPHSDHWHGRRAAEAVEDARHAVATLIGADPQGIVFTSGATEANNLALKGLLSRGQGLSLLWLSDIEHKSLLEPAHFLASTQGVDVRRLPVGRTGSLEPSLVATRLSDTQGIPGLVAIAHGNNELGTVQDVAALSAVAHQFSQLLHVDASQTAGHFPIVVEQDNIDLLCLSSHKMGGPAGIGALYVAPMLEHPLQPLLHGGGQERGVRSGTVAPFLAVGFGTAAQLARQRMEREAHHRMAMADLFISVLRERAVPFQLLGSAERRLPGHLSMLFPGVAADDLLAVLLPTLSISSGAACTSGEWRSSHVLRAIGLSEAEAGQVIRVSFGSESVPDHAEDAARLLVGAIQRIRQRDED